MEEPDPTAGAVGDEVADRDAARRAVEAAYCARLAAQISSRRRKERAWRNIIGEGDAVGELVVHPAQEVDDEVLIGEGCADVAQLVRQVLELVAVLGHREVALAEGM